MLIIGLTGRSLADADRRALASPQVSGVILFSRNVVDRDQAGGLVDAIRAERPGAFLVTIDQEGGPVQRLREGYTALPALARIGAVHDNDANAARALAEDHAWIMASELRATGIDLGFAPVADLARGNRAIGERAFHPDPGVVSDLVMAYLRGMRLAGMAGTLKHFPGHGSTAEDTHCSAAIDRRSLDDIRAHDLVPFAGGIAAGAEAVMMAHVTYPACDPLPAGYSERWIGEILRGELGFRGIVIGDDIGMAAAGVVGGIDARVDAHRRAGCDLVLACGAETVAPAIAACAGFSPCAPDRIAALAGCVAPTWRELEGNLRYAVLSGRVRGVDRV